MTAHLGESRPPGGQSQICDTSTYQVYGAAHDGSHHSGDGAGDGAFDAAHPSVGVDVTRGLDDGVRAQAHPVHKELIHQSGREPFLQRGQSVHFADGIEGVEDVAIVDLVGASALELALELHPSFDNLQRVREQTRAARRHSTEQEIHRDGVYGDVLRSCLDELNSRGARPDKAEAIRKPGSACYPETIVYNNYYYLYYNYNNNNNTKMFC